MKTKHDCYILSLLYQPCCMGDGTTSYYKIWLCHLVMCDNRTSTSIHHSVGRQMIRVWGDVRKWARVRVGTQRLFKFIETGNLSKLLRVSHLYRSAILGRLGNLKSGAAPHPFRVGAPILKFPRRPGTCLSSMGRILLRAIFAWNFLEALWVGTGYRLLWHTMYKGERGILDFGKGGFWT